MIFKTVSVGFLCRDDMALLMSWSRFLSAVVKQREVLLVVSYFVFESSEGRCELEKSRS